MPKRAAIIGNCQAQMLESMLMAVCENIEVVRFRPNFMMGEESKQDVLNTIATADFVFIQRVSESFPLEWLRPSFVRTLSCKHLSIWPNIYFDGYFPKVGYTYLPGVGKLCGPLDDYHVREIELAYVEGASVEAATRRLLEMGAMSLEDPMLASLRELKTREADCDIVISDFLEENCRIRKCMYSPNHPYNFVLAELLGRLCERADLAFDSSSAAEMNIRLDRIYLPASPHIVRTFGLKFDSICVYGGLSIVAVESDKVVFGPPRSYLPGELVAEFYKVYDAIRAGSDQGGSYPQAAKSFSH